MHFFSRECLLLQYLSRSTSITLIRFKPANSTQLFKLNHSILIVEAKTFIILASTPSTTQPVLFPLKRYSRFCIYSATSTALHFTRPLPSHPTSDLEASSSGTVHIPQHSAAMPRFLVPTEVRNGALVRPTKKASQRDSKSSKDSNTNFETVTDAERAPNGKMQKVRHKARGRDEGGQSRKDPARDANSAASVGARGSISSGTVSGARSHRGKRVRVSVRPDSGEGEVFDGEDDKGHGAEGHGDGEGDGADGRGEGEEGHDGGENQDGAGDVVGVEEGGKDDGAKKGARNGDGKVADVGEGDGGKADGGAEGQNGDGAEDIAGNDTGGKDGDGKRDGKKVEA